MLYVQPFSKKKIYNLNFFVPSWGQSAGAISVAMQMLAYGGTTSVLFHSAFMMSGAVIPVGNITAGQKYYDFLVRETGCSNSVDTLSCLRQIPISTLKSAVDKTPNIVSYQVGSPTGTYQIYKFLILVVSRWLQHGGLAGMGYF